MTQQKLFNHMYNEHGLTLLESEMDEIISICRENDQQHLLDDFAKAAMHAMLTTPKKLPELSGERLAEMAYTYADFMMQERERRMKG